MINTLTTTVHRAPKCYNHQIQPVMKWIHTQEHQIQPMMKWIHTSKQHHHYNTRRRRHYVQPCAASLMVSIAGATASATIKMVLICTVIARLVSQNILPPSTAATLSRVTFVVITPCMLFTRLASTLAHAAPSQQHNLFLLPLAMAVQVALGYALGTLGTFLARRGRGWHPTHNPTRAAKAIAATAALAVGAPKASSALQGSVAESEKAAKLDRLIITASAFGNSLTLPLVFLTTLFQGHAPVKLDAAIACTALVQIAWYPLVWSVGYKSLCEGSARTSATRSATLSAAMANRVGARVPPSSNVSVRRRLAIHAARAWAVVQTWLNPPLVGVAAGVAVGASGAAAWLFSTDLGPRKLPIELALVTAAARCVVDVVHILGSAALACQAIVLGASLASAADDSISSTAPPQEVPPWRAVAIVSTVRFCVLPALMLLIVQWARWAAPWCLDPMAAFVLCVQAVMPPAQSLAVMAQLGGSSACTSQLLLRVYAVAVVPVALWVAVFLRVLLV